MNDQRCCEGAGVRAGGRAGEGQTLVQGGSQWQAKLALVLQLLGEQEPGRWNVKHGTMLADCAAANAMLSSMELALQPHVVS